MTAYDARVCVINAPRRRIPCQERSLPRVAWKPNTAPSLRQPPPANVPRSFSRSISTARTANLPSLLIQVIYGRIRDYGTRDNSRDICFNIKHYSRTRIKYNIIIIILQYNI